MTEIKGTDGKKETGRGGESLAAKFLKSNGYRILAKNYKTNLGEIDLIATDNKELVFVEVKARKSDCYGAPAEAVTVHKQRKIAQVACQYIKRHALQGVPARFDVIEVYLYDGGKINHITRAFDSYLSF